MPAPACLLASSSPRRSQLLSQVGWQVRLVAAHTGEIWPDLAPGPAAQRVAEDKLAAAQSAHAAAADPAGDAIWLAADTVVVLRGEIFGKPKDAGDAVRMLQRLRGQTHQVITGFVAAWGGARRADCVVSLVTMRDYGDDELAAYVATGEAMDKSGAYAIQSGGTALSARIEGSLSNIVGLPIAEVLAAFASLRAAA